MNSNENTRRTGSGRVVVLGGDGIGPEIMEQAVRVLETVGRRFGHSFGLDFRQVGGCAYDACGKCLPDETLAACRSADAVLLGAVGGPKWDGLPGAERPERALLGLRSGLGLFCNLRPAKIWPSLLSASPLRPEMLLPGNSVRCEFSQCGPDILVVRELTGGIYFGRHERSGDGMSATDVMAYSVHEVDRIARMAFRSAMDRRRKVTSVDKANVLETSRLWRETVERVAKEFPEVALEHMYVDNAAMQLVRAPSRFDVLLTENMFGDILSDEASQITGSIGLLPSASLREDGFGMYEPIHGSAPDIAGRGIANPLATILSVAMMLRHSFRMPVEAGAVERAVGEALSVGLRTRDIAGDGPAASTREMGDAICDIISR